VRNGLDVPKNAKLQTRGICLGRFAPDRYEAGIGLANKGSLMVEKDCSPAKRSGSLCLLDGDERLLAYNPVETSLRGCVYLDIELTDSVRPRNCTP
jgi:hypothetical protein